MSCQSQKAIPTYTPVLEPISAARSSPPRRSASYPPSSSSRCCGSMAAASGGEMLNICASKQATSGTNPPCRARALIGPSGRPGPSTAHRSGGTSVMASPQPRESWRNARTPRTPIGSATLAPCSRAAARRSGAPGAGPVAIGGCAAFSKCWARRRGVGSTAPSESRPESSRGASAPTAFPVVDSMDARMSSRETTRPVVAGGPAGARRALSAAKGRSSAGTAGSAPRKRPHVRRTSAATGGVRGRSDARQPAIPSSSPRRPMPAASIREWMAPPAAMPMLAHGPHCTLDEPSPCARRHVARASRQQLAAL
eukprot:scaffold31815_cov118-Isochrysis_galbana.AAC.13